MSDVQAAELPAPLAMRAMFRQLQDETIWIALAALSAFGIVLIQVIAQHREPSAAILPCLVLYALLAVVLALRKLSYLATAWGLVVTGLAVSLLLVVQVGLSGAVSLLALPAALAALFISVHAGLLVAGACTLLLLGAPLALLPVAAELRTFALIGVWSTVGLIWLTLRPLLTTLEWSWSSYEQSRKLLEQARDRQVLVKQTLQDLADANVQLTRLNRLGQALRQAAEEARRAKEEFVANVSHELRTPLNMIIGFCEMIVKAPQTYGGRIPPALLADLAVVLRNSQHLSSLIDDVLDLSQIETGRMALTKERVALAEVVEAAATAVRPLYESKGLYLKPELAEGLPPVFCDRTRIREVVLNLLSNAGRFTEQGGVHIRARQEGGEVVVGVADSGPGVAPADADRLFQPFEQVDGSTRRRYGGSGLGLSISKALVEMHGGTMWLESEVGRGSTFYFRLPVDPPPPADGDVLPWLHPDWEYAQRTRRSEAPVPVTRPRLVVVESGGSLQRLLSRYLDGAEAVSVSSLEAAAQELARVPAQALLVNDVSVGEALQRLQSAPLPYGTPAIACAIPGAEQAAAALGIDGYLVKPISRERLLETLDRLELPGSTVLVVDDEPEAQRLFQRMLNSAARRYRVLPAGDGRQALDILREQRPDVILLDLLMPEMDGFRFLEARALAPELRTIPVVVTSAQDPEGRPVVSHALAVARGGGLTVPQLLACIEALIGILGAGGMASDQASNGKSET